ncbi:MAG: bifunctional hydroxymethylpyrimidine kinase/phosphomethylpyrimidine kinase [Syntrophales bacterium]|nr:bifunctional hydroxymethylpyrimidine kinase/phosphomethylpyrimidine kinase [Syntrophales bacterium]
MNVKRVLTIAGSDSGGGAGIQADIKTITLLGGFAMSVITAVTAQNTCGVKAIYEIPPEIIKLQLDAVLEDIGADAVKTGMLFSSSTVHAVAEGMRRHKVDLLIVDPVMVAKGGVHLLLEDAAQTLIRELIPLAFVITPNIPEAEYISGIMIETPSDMKHAAAIIHKMGARNVVIKGGHLSQGAVDILYDGLNYYEFPFERIPGEIHGTGCTYSAALATALANGSPITEAVARASRFIALNINNTLDIGTGHKPMDHFSFLRKHMENTFLQNKLR